MLQLFGMREALPCSTSGRLDEKTRVYRKRFILHITRTSHVKRALPPLDGGEDGDPSYENWHQWRYQAWVPRPEQQVPKAKLWGASVAVPGLDADHFGRRVREEGFTCASAQGQVEADFAELVTLCIPLRAWGLTGPDSVLERVSRVLSWHMARSLWESFRLSKFVLPDHPRCVTPSSSRDVLCAPRKPIYLPPLPQVLEVHGLVAGDFDVRWTVRLLLANPTAILGRRSRVAGSCLRIKQALPMVGFRWRPKHEPPGQLIGWLLVQLPGAGGWLAVLNPSDEAVIPARVRRGMCERCSRLRRCCSPRRGASRTRRRFGSTSRRRGGGKGPPKWPGVRQSVRG